MLLAARSVRPALVLCAVCAILVVRTAAGDPEDAEDTVDFVDLEDQDAFRGAPAGSSLRAPRRPCLCADGQCSCCSGFVMQSLVNIAPRQRGCLNITYDPDDFAFGMVLMFNERVLYKNTISAKNPRPLCVSVPRVTGAKLCVKLSNVYFVGRNLHACVDMEAKWQDTQAFQMTFDCIRVGADGVKVVKPEDGSGLVVGVPVVEPPAPDEYDVIPAEHPPENPDASSVSSTSNNKPSKPSKPSRPARPSKPSKPSRPAKPAVAAAAPASSLTETIASNPNASVQEEEEVNVAPNVAPNVTLSAAPEVQNAA